MFFPCFSFTLFFSFSHSSCIILISHSVAIILEVVTRRSRKRLLAYETVSFFLFPSKSVLVKYKKIKLTPTEYIWWMVDWNWTVNKHSSLNSIECWIYTYTTWCFHAIQNCYWQCMYGWLMWKTRKLHLNMTILKPFFFAPLSFYFFKSSKVYV